MITYLESERDSIRDGIDGQILFVVEVVIFWP